MHKKEQERTIYKRNKYYGIVCRQYYNISITPCFRRFEFAQQKRLERSNTFLSSFDTFLWEPVTKLAFPPWHAIGWFNTMTTGKRRQAANCVQSHLNQAR